jgi:SEC-C motif domain protein
MFCYCGSSKTFQSCCKPFLTGESVAINCEQLMRSRYSAYCQCDIDYIYRTYHSSVQMSNPPEALSAFAHNSHFIALEVLSAEQSTSEGFVSFNVRYMQHNLLFEFTERSRFCFENMRWFYVDGKLTDKPAIKLSRNTLCPCNSGKKFKQCSVHRLSGN